MVPAASPAGGFVLSSDGASPAAISLTWTAAGCVLTPTYSVAYSTAGPSGPWQTSTPSAGGTQYATGGLTPGATYWWQVTASGVGCSATSTVLSSTQPTLAYLTYSLQGSTSATFNWTNNASYGGQIRFGSYQLYEQAGRATPTLAATISNVAIRTATVTGLASGSSYTFYLNTSDCAGACGSSTPSVTESNAVTFGTPLTLLGSVDASRVVVDVGQLDFFTCTPSGGTSPFKFAWDFGNGTFVPGIGSESHAFSSPGPVTVTCRVTDSSGSQVKPAVGLTVNPDPVLTASVNRTSLDVVESASFNCVVSQGTVPIALSWAFGDGNQVPFGVTTHAYATTGQFAASCLATDSTGTQALSVTILTVDPLLVVQDTVSSPSAAPSTVLTFTAHPTNGSGTYVVYQWNFGDGTTGSGGTASHAYVRAGSYAARLGVTDSNGVTAAGTTTVTILTLSVNLASVPQSITVGASVTFSAAASGGAGGPYNYTWILGDGSTAYGAAVHHVFGKSGTYAPTLVVTDRLGARQSVAVPSLSVVPAPGLFAWITSQVTVAFGIATGAVVGFLAYTRSRRMWLEGSPAVAGWIPPTDPSRTVRGMKVCRSCGNANLPLRETCETCGASLSRLSLR